MLPHPAASDRMVTMAQRGRSVANLRTCNSTIATAAAMEVVLTAGMLQWPGALQM